MTTVLAAVAAGLAVAVALMLISQRRMARRLVRAGERLAPDVVPGGLGLAEATSVVERVVDRSLSRGAQMSVAEARLRGALAWVPEGIVVFDADGEIAFRNRVAAGYLHARHSEALVEEGITELAAQVLASSGPPRPTRTIELFGPPRRTLVLQATGLVRDERELGAVVVIDDITDQRRLEAMRRDFVANISHELKTPIGALGLLAETLASEDEPAVVRRLAHRMQGDAFRVARTIDDLLELSRIEADPRFTRDAVALGPMVTEAVERVRAAAELQGISIETSTDAIDATVMGDRRQLVSAVYNLLDNAVKYSGSGSTVRVSVRSDGQWVDVAVSDEGIGIPRRDLERVFERFYRVDRARSRESGGTGLGLAIVRHVADNHDGEVRVDSVEGEGSTFSLRLPEGGTARRAPASAVGSVADGQP
ncbi:MAG: sensor histidine kinase [Microthrixaceae bacterium]